MVSRDGITPKFQCYRRRGLQGKLTCNGSGKRSSVIPVVFACSLNLRAATPEPSGATAAPDKDGAWISTKRIFPNLRLDFVVKQPSASHPPILRSMYPIDAPRTTRVADLGPTMDSPPGDLACPPAPLPKAPISRE